MHFTREPLIETVIAPREGFRLLVRSSKAGAPEEFYVDSVQVVMIGSHCFYRTLEKPKPFLLPASDYEIIEVRETRLSVKLPSKEAGEIKIAGGRETSLKAAPAHKEEEEVRVEEEELASSKESASLSDEEEAPREKGGRNRRFRKRRKGDERRPTPPSSAEKEKGGEVREEKPPSQMIPPPQTLISETISRYKDLPDFAGAFFEKGAEELVVEDILPLPPAPSVEEPITPPPPPPEESDESENFNR